VTPPGNTVRPGEKEISINEILKIIFRRKFGVIAIITLSLFAALFNHYAETPEYRAVAVIMIKGAMGQNDMISAVLGGSSADNMAVKKDVKLLKSMPIAELTVSELYKSGGRDSLEFFGNKEYQSPVASLVKPFSAVKSWLMPKKIVQESAEQRFRRYAKDLNSRIKVDVDRETNVLDLSVASPFPDEAVFLSNTLAQVYKQSDITRNSEKYAQANIFITQMLKDQQKKVDDSNNALTRYMKGHEIYEFSGNTQKLLDKLIETDSRYNDILTEYRITKNSLDFLDKKLSAADKEKSARIAQNVNTQLGSIMDEMRAAESDYMNLLREKGTNDPDVKAKRQQFEVVKTRYDQLSRSKIAGQIGYAGKSSRFSFDTMAQKLETERKLNDLNFSSGEFNRLKKYYVDQLSTLPNKQQDYANLLRDKEVVNKTYIFLKEKLDETGILLGSEVGSVALIGSAFRPFVPEKPDLKKSVLMGLVLGLLLASAYIYGAETLDDTVMDETFFRDIGLTLLSIIPVVTENGKSAFSGEHISRISRLFYNKSKAFRDKVITSGSSVEGKPLDNGGEAKISMPRITADLNSPFAESFRTLRTSLEYTRIGGQLKSILVSGTAMSEGKSTVCANLGIAYALVGKKTLIIDCDLRRASLHKKMNVRREPGLTDYLFSQQQEVDDTYFQSTDMENLFLLTAGKRVPNPNELLASPKMLEFLKLLEGKFDMVLLDSPPLFLSDAAELARSVDGTLLVARLKYSSKKPLQEYSMDPFLKPLTLGVVAIAPRDSSHYWFGRYGYGKYGYGKYGYGKYGYGKYGYSRYGYGKHGYEDDNETPNPPLA
jgi:capsular exopolysaccharide synthesis family protein